MAEHNSRLVPQLPQLASDDVRRALFPGIYEAEFDYVHRSVRRLGVDFLDLDDVTQEVFMVAYRCLQDFQAGRPVRPWLFGIATGVVANYRRLARHAHEKRDSDLNESAHVDPQMGPLDAVAAQQDRLLVRQALEALPLERRAVFILYELDGCAMADIAESLAVPVNTAYSRLRVARSEFTQAIRRLKPVSANE